MKERNSRGNKSNRDPPPNESNINRDDNWISGASQEKQAPKLAYSVHDGILIIDQEGITTFTNSRIAEMLGYTPAEMVGQSLFSFMSDTWVEVAREKLIANQGKTEQRLFEFLHKDGHPISTFLDSEPLFDANNQVVGAVASVIDMSALKEEGEEIRSLALELTSWIQ